MNVHLDAPQRAVRRALAALSATDYAGAVSSLEAYRGATIAQDLTLSFIAPTRQDWVSADLGAVEGGALDGDLWLGFSLLSSVVTLADTERVFSLGGSRDEAIWRIGMAIERIYSMCVNVGPGCEYLVAELFDGNLTADHKKRMTAILVDFDTDAAPTAPHSM